MAYRALVVDKQGDAFSVAVRDLSEADLPPGDVTIRVHWSSINYKDGLALSPGGRVIRSYPMVPGVDLAGVVLESKDIRFAPGQEVVVTGYDVGVSHPGGFAELARVPGDWVMPLPAGLTLKEAMAIGTAGFTAALSLEALEHNGLRPANGTVIVTGATGGVGSTAVAMLAQAGYTVAASTGKASEHAYLRELGASEILSREEVSAESTRPLESERWAGAVDPVGGATTAYLIRTMKYGAEHRPLRPHRRQRHRDDRLPLHPPQREPPRHRLGVHADGEAAAHLAAARDRPQAPRPARLHRRRNRPRGRARRLRRHPPGQGPRPDPRPPRLNYIPR
ncbi:MAG: hypothetical protein KatS3mg064_2400 [Tepidiforma sp.]|nr:acryloyl-CoA reductase [Tepidiforma sp.]GIW19243.1 MAG: hypothetical protein KatS3mg064_2400 [Tepidiforma sp.]